MHKLFPLLVSICVSCKGPESSPSVTPVPHQENASIPISIMYGLSYEFNLEQEKYKIYFTNKSPAVVKFHLTYLEKKEIYSAWSKVKVNLADSVFKFDDHCTIMPKIYTTIRVKLKNGYHEVVIDDLCDDFTEYELEAKDVKRFIGKVRNIIKAKPEMQHIPESDIIYM